ncbi:hypothetical protein FSP39_004730 [Pinctada imbricata]|uniref:Selenoprotein F n=1 Tax=Pinctada imbricata TaxID=66713 RepID=A0AA89BUV3_PINIB|nr:hypothetical protein FSP39_004730 [Pinctada imbricata]
MLIIDKAVGSELSAEECRGLGFITTDLMCSSCNELDQFNLSSLKESCQKCCSSDSDGEESLKVLYYMLSFKSFVKSDRPKQFPGLAIRYVRGADPIIKLMDENRVIVEELGIDKWNTDSVEAFFQERLRR